MLVVLKMPMLTLYKCETPISSKPGTQDFISSYGYKQLQLHMSKGRIMFFNLVSLS